MTQFILAACSLGQPQDGTLTREQLIDVLVSTQDDLRDFVFQFEGVQTVFRFPSDESGLPREMRLSEAYESPDKIGSTYQGTIAYRSDGALHLDVYVRPADERKPTRREIRLLVGQERSERVLVPDEGGITGPDRSEPGHIGGLLGPASPLYMVSYPYLLAHLKGGQGYRYVFAGWEEVDGAKCAVVRLVWSNPKTGEATSSQTFWLDLGRGGHPLRFETHVGGELASRVRDVKLVRVATEENRSVWFPVRARQEGFGDGIGRYASRATSEQTYDVLDGTLQINEDLGNRRFHLDYGLDVATLDRARRANRGELDTPDPRSDEQRLNDALAEAEATSEEQVASSPARAAWHEKHAMSLGVVGFSTLVLVIAGFLWKRAT